MILIIINFKISTFNIWNIRQRIMPHKPFPETQTRPNSGSSCKGSAYAAKEADIARIYQQIVESKNKSVEKRALHPRKNEEIQRQKKKLNCMEMITRSNQSQPEGQSNISSSQCSFIKAFPDQEQF